MNTGAPARTGFYLVRTAFSAQPQRAYYYAPMESWYTGMETGSHADPERLRAVLGWNEIAAV